MRHVHRCVESFPRFRWSAAWVGRGSPGGPFARPGWSFRQGRDAIYWAFVGLGLPRGHRAWLPAFNCGVEVDAAVDAGLDVGFYRLGRDLAVDLADLQVKLRERPGPVLVIHYFGFPQPGIRELVEMCGRQGAVVIEDCAHGLFSRTSDRALGDFGALTVFSLPKTLGVYRGGVLQVAGERFRASTGREFLAPPPVAARGETYRILAKDQLRRSLGTSATRAYRRWRFGEEDAAPADDAEATHQPEVRDRAVGLERLPLRIAASADGDRIRRQRRENYERLAARLAGLEPVFGELPAGVCPLVLPVWVERREALQADLRALGIDCFVFGKWRHPLLPDASYPEAAVARRHILGLPVHQDLRTRQVDQVAAGLAQVRGGRG